MVGNISADSDCGDFMNTLDIIGTDAYITPPRVGTPGQNINTSVDWITKYACIARDRAKQYGKVFWMVLAAEFYSGTNKRIISPEEQRCQTYLALIHGAKGILYYFYPIKHQDTWDLFKDYLTDEISTLTPSLFTLDLEQTVTYGTNTFNPANNQFVDVQVCLRKAPAGANYDYVLLVANTRRYPVDVTYDISLLGSSGTVSRLFSQSTYSVSDGSFSEQLAGFATRAYTFDSESTNPITIDVAMTPRTDLEPDAETGHYPPYPLSGRPDKTNLMQNPDLEDNVIPNWPDYCKAWYIKSYRVNSANQHWGLINTPDLSSLEDEIENDGGDPDNESDPGSTCLKITKDSIMNGFYFNLALESQEDYTFTVYIKKEGTGFQKARIGSSDIDYEDITLTESWIRYEYTCTVPYNDGEGLPYQYFYVKPLYDGTIYVDAVQVEKSDTATAFTTD